MDILERLFVGTAVACLVILVGLTGTLMLSPGDTIPEKVLQALRVSHASKDLGPMSGDGLIVPVSERRLSFRSRQPAP